MCLPCIYDHMCTTTSFPQKFTGWWHKMLTGSPLSHPCLSAWSHSTLFLVYHKLQGTEISESGFFVHTYKLQTSCIKRTSKVPKQRMSDILLWQHIEQSDDSNPNFNLEFNLVTFFTAWKWQRNKIILYNPPLLQAKLLAHHVSPLSKCSNSNSCLWHV